MYVSVDLQYNELMYPWPRPRPVTTPLDLHYTAPPPLYPSSDNTAPVPSLVTSHYPSRYEQEVRVGFRKDSSGATSPNLAINFWSRETDRYNTSCVQQQRLHVCVRQG